MSTQTVVVDPVTRIEGHLRIEAQFDGTVITEAMSSGTMVRGIEIILRDRDSRNAFAACARWCMGSPRCARSKARSTTPFP
jgi:hydrogenase large subunit